MNSMTHYMELLATNQPWHLILFMAIPVILAETLAITELVILFSRNLTGGIRAVNKIAGILAGVYFTRSIYLPVYPCRYSFDCFRRMEGAC